MDPVKLLMKQHREVEALFKKIEQTEKANERKELMGQIKQKLELYEEHHVVKLVLAELPNVDPEDERFEAKMTVLKELVEHHVEEEEQDKSGLFKLAKKLGKEHLEELGDRMAAEAGSPQGRRAA